MAIINLTPHIINVVSPTGEPVANFPPSGTVARVRQERILDGERNGVRYYRTTYGEVQDLPSEVVGTTYVVSALVRGAVPGRLDVVSPGALVRDANGQPVGCEGFDINL